MTLTIGVSGTRETPTKKQLVNTRKALSHVFRYATHRFEDEDIDLRHGNCIGFDEYIAVVGSALMMRVISHPPNVYTFRSKLATTVSDVVHDTKNYLARNDDIVANSDFIIAAPQFPTPNVHSGTWYTIRTAIQVGQPTIVFMPDGTVDHYLLDSKPRLKDMLNAIPRLY